MNLLVTGAWKCDEAQLNELKNLGHEVIFMQQEKDELPCAYEWVEGTICNGLFLSHPIERFTNLKYIQLTSAGYDRVPMDYVESHHIKIHNARGVYSIPMAEFALSGVLQLYKQSRFFYENQKARRWEKHRGLLELNGKTVCIMGCGSVGTECAKRFAAFGCRVIGVDLRPYESEYFEAIHPINDTDKILPESDIVILTLPLTDQTRYFMSQERLCRMKPGAVLVNIARGAVLDTRALTEALKFQLYGAVLDVFEEEPLSESSPLWDMENVIITPHNSFVGDGNSERLYKRIINKLSEDGERYAR